VFSVAGHQCRQSGRQPDFAGSRRAPSPRLPFSISTQESPAMNKFLPYPLFVLFSIVAFNITAFAVVLQLNMLIINATVYKVIAWLVTVVAWTVVYFFRNR
jgi:hypothetical protein